MATVGPLVRNNVLFVIAILGLPLIIFLNPGKLPAAGSNGEENANPAERRKLLASAQRQQRWQRVAGVFGIIIISFLCLDFVYARGPATLSPAETVTPHGQFVQFPVAKFDDGLLHRFSFDENGRKLRFFVIKIVPDQLGVAFDACENCGDQGYYQENQMIFCLNCVAEINPATIGIGGGCNPIALAHAVANDTLRIATHDLRAGMKYFKQL
ncbi:MAG: hypothetical protein ALAOOOJD_04731 [bacterium]|nr:hypothetical protein [bacterium]